MVNDRSLGAAMCRSTGLSSLNAHLCNSLCVTCRIAECRNTVHSYLSS